MRNYATLGLTHYVTICATCVVGVEPGYATDF